MAPIELKNLAKTQKPNISNTFKYLNTFSNSFHAKLSEISPDENELIYDKLNIDASGNLNVKNFNLALGNYLMAAAWAEAFHNKDYIGIGANRGQYEYIVHTLSEVYRKEKINADLLFIKADIDKSGTLNLREFSATDVIVDDVTAKSKFNFAKTVDGEMNRKEFEKVRINELLVSATIVNDVIYKQKAEHKLAAQII